MQSALSLRPGAVLSGCRQASLFFNPQLNQGCEPHKLKQNSHPASTGSAFARGQSENCFSKSRHWWGGRGAMDYIVSVYLQNLMGGFCPFGTCS